MKNDIINVNPRCDCGGRQILDSALIDPGKCEYRFSYLCLTCGETNTYILSIDGFIELPKLPKNIRVINLPSQAR